MKNSEKTCFFFFRRIQKNSRIFISIIESRKFFYIRRENMNFEERRGFRYFFFLEGKVRRSQSILDIFREQVSPPPQDPSFALITRFVIRQPLPLSSNKAPLPPRSSQKFYFSEFLFARSLKFVSLRSRERSRSARYSHFSFPRFLLPFPFRSFFKFDLNRSLNFLIEILSFIRYPFACSWMMNKGIKGKLVFLKLFFLFLHAWKLMIQREGRRGMKIALIREKSVWTEWRETVVARSGSQNKSNLPFH